MFEEKTFESILYGMLERVPDGFDKREGSIIYDALAAAAAEFAIGYIQMDMILNETFADTASRPYLELRAAERDIYPEEASATIVKAAVEPSNIVLVEGDRFNLGEYNYIFYSKCETKGEYLLICETMGSQADYNMGYLTPVTVIDGLESIKITEIYKKGSDDEETEHFRERYFNSLQSLASGGNIAWYKETLGNIEGVGGVKVFTANDIEDGGRVDVYITDEKYGVPSNDFINWVQTIIDPVQNGGEGLGLAPIGHTVKIKGVKEKMIKIETNILFGEGWNAENAKDAIEKRINEYFKEVNSQWDNSENIVLRVSQIESCILELEFVTDIWDTLVNGQSKRLILEREETAVLQNITVNEGV